MSGTTGGLARFPTGIDGLDTITNGGFFRGGVYIVQGKPGTGKTTLGNQICFNHARAGGRAVYCTLLAEYHGRMFQHLSGMSFFDELKVPEQVNYINGFGTLREGGYTGLRDLLRREISTQKASVIILDGFATVQRKAPEEQDFNEFIHELQGVAIATDCTMFLLSSAEGVRDTPEYTIVDGILELSNQLVGWASESTLQVIKLRGTNFLRGRHAFRITGNGIVAYPRIEALFPRPSLIDSNPVEPIGSGMSRLDTMLGGGLPASSATMVMGPSGVGKTTLGLQFLAQCSEAEPGLFFGFYETPARIAAKVDGVCAPLRGLIDSGVVELIWQPPTDGLLDGYGARILETVRRRGVRRLVIDDLGAFKVAAVDPVRLNQYLTALMNELRVLGVTTVFTLMVPEIMANAIDAPIDGVPVLSDNLILMRYVELRSRLYRLLSIVKARNSNFDPSLHEFSITGRGIRIKDTPDSAEMIMAGLAQHTGATLHDPARAVRDES